MIEETLSSWDKQILQDTQPESATPHGSVTSQAARNSGQELRLAAASSQVSNLLQEKNPFTTPRSNSSSSSNPFSESTTPHGSLPSQASKNSVQDANNFVAPTSKPSSTPICTINNGNSVQQALPLDFKKQQITLNTDNSVDASSIGLPTSATERSPVLEVSNSNLSEELRENPNDDLQFISMYRNEVTMLSLTCLNFRKSYSAGGNCET